MVLEYHKQNTDQNNMILLNFEDIRPTSDAADKVTAEDKDQPN